MKISKLFIVLRFGFLIQGSPCGGHVRSPLGWLSAADGDHDGNYDISHECLWTIMAPENHVIVVQLLYLSINDRNNCEDEKLTVRTIILACETEFVLYLAVHENSALPMC